MQSSRKSVTLKLFVSILLTILFVRCNSNGIVLETDYFQYKISAEGKNLQFLDKKSGKDYLDTETATKCASVTLNGTEHEVTAISRNGNLLRMEFGESGIVAQLQVRETGKWISIVVESLNQEVEAFNFLNIPLALEGQPNEPFAACALAMNLKTHVRQLPPLQTSLWAKCYTRFGLEGAGITLVGIPQEQMLGVVREVVADSKDIPFSDAGGAWALTKKEGYGSYLMNFGTLTEETVDDWIETCHKLGFNQIDSHGGNDFFEFGTFDLNREKWPEGWESFKRINEKLHKANISHIFHTYAFFIDKKSRYVTPTPSENLGYVSTFTLAEPLGENAAELTVNEPTAGISTITGFHTENSVSLRIGKEIIEFTGVTKSPPWKFTGLRRGANGTVPSAHPAGETAFHLSERFGLFVPNPESELFDEIAKRHAEIVNHCSFDGIYLDAIDGSAVLAGEENFWYYGSKFIFEIARHLERPVGMEMSSMSHMWWHYRSRWQAWDRPIRGYKRFIDIHLASIKASALFLPEKIKSNEWEHGIWKGHSPLIDKYAGMKGGQINLPLHLGWWGNQTWAPPQTEPTFPDDIEYLGCKMIGNDAGFSQLGGVDEKTLREIPLFQKAATLLAQYEKLRHENYFSEEVKEILRQPGKEFTLFREKDGKWNFKPVVYEKHKVRGLDHPSSKWTANNPFDQQPLKIRIEALMAAKTYDDPGNILLTNYSDSAAFKTSFVAEGVSGALKPSGEKTDRDETSILFSAVNAGKTPQDEAYLCVENTFEKNLDIRKNKALGVWIKGDGGGQLLNISLRSPDHISHGAHGDHFVKIDFEGWRYFELIEIESAEISDYMWPDDSHFYVYDSYRHIIDFGRIEKLQFWYNNLPAGRTVNTLIGPVKALPMVSCSLKNPEIIINGKKLTFPVTLESGMYLEMMSADSCILYGSKGEFLGNVKPLGEVVEMKKGNNEIEFSFEGSAGINSRAQVTLITQGSPLVTTKKE